MEAHTSSRVPKARTLPSSTHTFHGWSRSLSLPGVAPRWRAVLDAVVVLLAQALPLPRLLVRRGDLIDVVLLAARAGTLVGTAGAYERRRAAYWLSPLALSISSSCT